MALLVLALQAFVPPLGSFAFAAGPKPAARGKAAFTAGLEAIRRVELNVAVSRLEEAIAAELSSASGIDFGRVRDARLQLAATRLRRGEEDEARRALADVVRWDPDYTPPRNAFPPVFVRELDRARASLDRTGRLRVTSPEGAAVRLDGRSVGAVPLMLRELPRGRHVVEVDLPGGEVFAQFVDLEAIEVFVAAEGDAQSRAQAETRDPLTLSLSKREGANAGSEVPLTLSLSKREEAEAGRDHRRAPPAAKPPTTPTSDAPTASKRVPSDVKPPRPAFKSSRRRKAEELAATKRDPRVREKRTEWWVWVLGGVGVAALAGGTYWGIRQATRPVTGTVSTTW